MKNLISVIIPVFNGEKFIEKAVRSALNQSHSPLEVIVVDDGSTDGTAAILAGLGDAIQVIGIANSGVSNARNVGIRASRGEILAFLDADDVWDSNKLQEQLAVMKRYPSVAFCCCDFIVFNKYLGRNVKHIATVAKTRPLVFDRPLTGDPYVTLIRTNFVGTASNVMVRRSLLDSTGLFDTNYRQAEDYDLWLRCALLTDFVILSHCLLRKVTHDHNLTGNYLETLQCHEQVLMKIQRENKAHLREGKRWQTSQLALAETRYAIGNLLYERGAYFQAFRLYFRSFLEWPSGNNLRMFSFYFSRKFARFISFGLIRNRAAGSE